MSATCGLAAGFKQCNQQRQQEKNNNIQETEATIELHKQNNYQRGSPEQTIGNINNIIDQHCDELGTHPLELKAVCGQEYDDQNKSTSANQSKSRTFTGKGSPPPPPAPDTIDEDATLKQRPPYTLITFKGAPAKGLAASTSSFFDRQSTTTASSEQGKKRKNTFGHADDHRERPLIDRNSLESIHSKFSTSSANDVTLNTTTTTGHSSASTSSSSPIEPTNDSNNNNNNNNNNNSGSNTSRLRRGCCCPRPDVAIVATRYVSPPRIQADWSPSKPVADQETKTPEAELSSVQMDELDGGQRSARSRASGKANNDSNSHDHKHYTQPAQVANQFAGLALNNEKAATTTTKTPVKDLDQVKGHDNGTNNNNSNKQKKMKKKPSSASSLSTTSTTTTQPFRPIKKKGPFPFAGILASILGSVFFSFSILCIKLLPDDTTSLAEKNKALFFRGVIITTLCAITIPIQKTKFSIPRDEILVNFLRSFFGFLGVFGAYIALKYISMGDSTALVFSSPVWTSLLSHFILKEPLHWIIVFALPVSLFGIVLIAHPALIINMEHTAGDIERQPLIVVPTNNSTDLQAANINITQTLLDTTTALFNYTHQQQHPGLINADLDAATMAAEPYDIEHRWPGIVIALCTSLMVSCVYIVLKFRKTTHIQTTTFWLGVWTILCCAFVMCFTGTGKMPASLFEWTILIANGSCSWMGQGLIQWALMHEDASILSVVRTLDVAITFTLSALFLHEEILWTSIVGATIIGLVVVSIVLNNWIASVLRGRASQLEVDLEEPHNNHNHHHCLEEVDLKSDSRHRQMATLCSKDNITNAHHEHEEATKTKGISAAA